MIKIAITDDHQLMAESLSATLRQHGGYEVTAHAATCAECQAMLAEHHDVDVLLLSVGLPDGNSLNHVEAWKKSFPALRILMLTSHDEPAVIRRALASGAAGYVLKTCGLDELLAALHAVMRGETYLCPRASEALQASPEQAAVVLTPREQEVLRFIVEGYSIKMIADRLSLGFETVHSYCKNLKHKLGVPNTAALVRVAMEQRLV